MSKNRKVSKNSTTGCSGVWKTSNNTYRVSIHIKGKRKCLGTFPTLEEAVKVRKEAEEKYFGEYRRKD